MSQSPAPPPQVQPQHEYRLQPPLDSPYAGGSAEAWISIAIGVILFFATYAQRLVQYLLSPDSFTWTFRDETGAPLAYSETVFIWGDAAMLLFCTVLIFEGIVLFIRKPMLIAIAFGVTVITVAVNMFYLAGMMTRGYGFQIASALAVAFGVYIAILQWRRILLLRNFGPGS